MTYDRAFEAIDEVFADLSVSAEETAARLKGLRDRIDLNLRCLAEDGVDVASVIAKDAPE